MDIEIPAHINFWLTEAEHDCHFVVGPKAGETERIGAVKVLLIAHSEPLKAMFGSSEIAEKGDVHIVDVTTDTFKIFLRCIYGASDLIIPKLSFEGLIELFYVADKYLVIDLKPKVSAQIVADLNYSNIHTALSSMACLEEITLANEMLQITRRYSRHILSDAKFLDLSSSALLWILKQRNLNIREVEIWKAVVSWGKHKSNSSGKRLGKCIVPFLRYIRFLTMDLLEFCRDVVPCDVLTNKEVYEICKYFGTDVVPYMECICDLTEYR